MRILFVDDTPATRELFQVWFTLEGHVTETASGGLEVLRLIEQGATAYDVIVLDYHMPGIDGLEVVQRLNNMEEWPRVPILLFTGDTGQEIVREAQALGVARVVHKPLMPDALLAIALDVVHRFGVLNLPSPNLASLHSSACW